MIGDLIRKERTRQGHSASGLARLAAVNADSLASVERSAATVATMNNVIEALHCRLTWTNYQAGQPLGAEIRASRHHRGITQQVLAGRIGVTTRTLISLENHTRGRMTVLETVLRVLRIKPKVVPKNRRLVPTRNSPELDVVYTPRDMARDVVSHFDPSGVILEPCLGDGSFLDAFPAGADARWCEIDQGRDFFDHHEPVDWVISNPPWPEFRAFNQHAMGLATNVVWVVPLVHFSSKARIRDVREAGFGLREILLLDTPREWPQGGFQIAGIHLRRGHTGLTRIAGLPGRSEGY